jgi:hypothetical protein
MGFSAYPSLAETAKKRNSSLGEVLYLPIIDGTE